MDIKELDKFYTKKDIAKYCISLIPEIEQYDMIAFILPNTFSKINNQSIKLFPENWSLILEEKLPKKSFLFENIEYDVPCSFFIWTRQKTDINLRKKKLPFSEDFIFLSRNSEDADFCVNGNSGKIKNLNEITNPKAEHFIKGVLKNSEELKKIFSELKYKSLSSVNGENYWISQQEILESYYNQVGRK